MPNIWREHPPVKEVVEFLDGFVTGIQEVFTRPGQFTYAQCVVRPEQIALFQQAADLLRPAIEPKTHIASGGHDPDEKRFSARDVQAMIDITMALRPRV